MSRPLRIDYPNAWHHVMNRTRRGTALFIDKTDFQQFIDLLQETTGLVKRLDQHVWSSTEPLMRIGARFGLNRYSSVSSVVIRVKTKLQKDRKFKNALHILKT